MKMLSLLKTWKSVRTVIGVEIRDHVIVPVIVEYVKMGRQKEVLDRHIEEKYLLNMRSDEVEWALTEARMMVET